MKQPIEDAGKLYNQNLIIVLNFFASKLRPYYSSSRLTLLLTFLCSSKPNYLGTSAIALPSRLEIVDKNALGLHRIGGFHPEDHYWKIFQDFLDSDDPLALDERRYTITSLICLKILFGRYQAPVLRVTWFSQHSRTLRADHSQRSYAGLPVVTTRGDSIRLYWELRTCLPNLMRQGTHVSAEDILFKVRRQHGDQYSRSNQLQFLLQKSAYSDNILNFARYSVFRFAYLARQHPVYMKKAIFSVAKYIQRATGETAEVRACELIWGRDRWFTAQ
jgi:hypothetical protein